MLSERILIRWLFRHALQRGQAVAWLEVDAQQSAGDTAQPVTWAALAAEVLRVADALRAAGVTPGCRVVTALSNGRGAVWHALALQVIGAVESPCGPDVDGAAVAQQMQAIDANFCLADPHRDDLRQTLGTQCLTVDQLGHDRLLPACPSRRPPADQPPAADLRSDFRRALQLAGRIDPTAAALILRTSGTTSAPRHVVLSAHALASNAAGKLAAAPQRDRDVRLTVLPLAHAYARTCDLGTWLISGGVLAATSGWQGLRQAAPTVRPTVMNLVPSLAERLSADDRSRTSLARLGLDRLRLLGCGGAALSADLFDHFRRLGITVIQGYGLTEAGPVICSASPDDARPGSVGRPVGGWQVRVDAQRRLWARGPGLMTGYWNDPQATSEKIQNGWLDTGDLAEADADGCWRILGRHDDTIVLLSGWKVFPLAIEQRLAKVDGVARAVVFGDGRRLGVILQTQRPRLGQPQLQAAEWQRRFEAALADRPKHERPARVVILPRPLSQAAGELTAKGTVRRAAVIARWGIAETQPTARS